MQLTSLVVLAATAVVTVLMTAGVEAKQFDDVVTLPKPKQIPVWNQRATWTLGKDVARVTAIISVNEKGIVGSVSTTDEVSAALVPHVESYLKTIVFTPLTIGGRKTAGKELIRIIFRPGLGYFDMEFPIDSSGTMVDQHFFDSLAQVNDCVIPRLETFPPYHCGVTYKDTGLVPQFCLLKVTIDTSGAVTDARVSASTVPPAIQSQLNTAARWASFSPARVQGKRVESTCYVAVFLFPEVNYPAQAFIASDTSRQTLLDKYRIYEWADSPAFLMLPVPRGSISDTVYLSQPRKSWDFDTMNVFVKVDEKGQQNINFPPGLSAASRKDLKDAASKMKFYPARSLSGDPVTYRGIVRIIFEGSTTVRIKCLWLQ